MSRIIATIALFVLVASACASSTTVPTHAAGAGAGGLVGSELTDEQLAAAMATPVPVLGAAATPEPTLGPVEQVRVTHDEALEDEDPDDDKGPDVDEPDDEGPDEDEPDVDEPDDEGPDEDEPDADEPDDDAHDDGSATQASTSAGPVGEMPLAERFAVGRCYRSADRQAGEALPCTESHRGEVIRVGQLSFGENDGFPGFDELREISVALCQPVGDGLGLVDASAMTLIPMAPIPGGWRSGDRSYVCFIEFDTSVKRSLASIIAGQQADRAERDAERDAQRQAAHEDAAEQFVAEQQINVGDCVTANSPFVKVPCSQPHGYTAYARSMLASAGGVYPGDTLMDEQTREFCLREHANADLGGSVWALWPQQWEWEEYGIHAFVCLVSTS